MKKRILKTLVATCMTAMMFVGCTSNGAANEEIKMGDTVKVTDVRGEVEIPANPQRIVDLSGNSDILSILGYKVVGTANSDAYDYTKFPSYLEETLSGAKILGYSMQDTMDVEAVMNLNPDLIVISTVQEKMYDALSKIAPTVMIQLEALNWKDDVRALGKVFDKEDVANEWIANYEAKAKEAGDTLGGKFEVIYENLPIGLGSFVHWDRMLDGKIAQAVMSIPAVKSVSIGNQNAYKMMGSEFHDQMYLENGKIVRKTNNAGGIEGGMTNGEPLVITAVMKPIPTLRKPLKTIDLKNMEQTEAHFERSDTCAVEACSVVAENRIACVLLDEFLLKYGGDNFEEIKNRL